MAAALNASDAMQIDEASIDEASFKFESLPSELRLCCCEFLDAGSLARLELCARESRRRALDRRVWPLGVSPHRRYQDRVSKHAAIVRWCNRRECGRHTWVKAWADAARASSPIRCVSEFERYNPHLKEMRETARRISRRGHGILATDESMPTAAKWMLPEPIRAHGLKYTIQANAVIRCVNLCYDQYHSEAKR